jgi:hypothetical protein
MLANQVSTYAAIQIQPILPPDNADPFYPLLNRPPWFLDHFIPAFETWRRDHNGIIFIAYDYQRPIGCIYVEIHPPHLVHGEYKPVFGWLEAENQYVVVQILNAAENYVIEHGGASLRGPINHPKFFGGWGVLMEDSYEPMLVNNTATPSLIGKMLEQAGYNCDTEYISVLQNPSIPECIV